MSFFILRVIPRFMPRSVLMCLRVSPPQVSLVCPVIFLMYCAFLLTFSFYSEPIACGMGLAIMMTGIPVYFLAVHWENKPKWCDISMGETWQCLFT